MSNLIEEFNKSFPGYRLETSDDEGFKLLKIDGITNDEGSEDVWIATVYEMAELFTLFEYNRLIVNERQKL